jgi:hypothetical protein
VATTRSSLRPDHSPYSKYAIGKIQTRNSLLLAGGETGRKGR